jgi:hypothetical protein
MMAEEETVTVSITDMGRPLNSPARWVEATCNMTVLALFNKVMYSAAVDERWHWVARQHEAVLCRPPNAAGAQRLINWKAPLSAHVDPGTNIVRFILQPPSIVTHTAVGAGARRAAVAPAIAAAGFLREDEASLQSPHSIAASARSGFSSVEESAAYRICQELGLNFFYADTGIMSSLEPTVCPTVSDVDSAHIWGDGEVEGYREANSALISLLTPYLGNIADATSREARRRYSGQLPVLVQCNRRLRIITDREYSGTADYCFCFNRPLQADHYTAAELVIEYKTTTDYCDLAWDAQMLMESAALWTRGGQRALMITELKEATLVLIDAASQNLVRIVLLNTAAIVRAMVLLAMPNFRVHALFQKYFFPVDEGVCSPPAAKRRRRSASAAPARTPARTSAAGGRTTRNSKSKRTALKPRWDKRGKVIVDTWRPTHAPMLPPSLQVAEQLDVVDCFESAEERSMAISEILSGKFEASYDATRATLRSRSKRHS